MIFHICKIDNYKSMFVLNKTTILIQSTCCTTRQFVPFNLITKSLTQLCFFLPSTSLLVENVIKLNFKNLLYSIFPNIHDDEQFVHIQIQFTGPLTILQPIFIHCFNRIQIRKTTTIKKHNIQFKVICIIMWYNVVSFFDLF